MALVPRGKCRAWAFSCVPDSGGWRAAGTGCGGARVGRERRPGTRRSSLTLGRSPRRGRQAGSRGSPRLQACAQGAVLQPARKMPRAQPCRLRQSMHGGRVSRLQRCRFWSRPPRLCGGRGCCWSFRFTRVCEGELWDLFAILIQEGLFLKTLRGGAWNRHRGGVPGLGSGGGPPQ